MGEKDFDIRPWGRWDNLHEGSDHKVKKITIKPGHRLSLQKHKHRDEFWFVFGRGCVMTHQEKSFEVPHMGTVKIEKDEIHRVENRGEDELLIIEIQTGEYLGEDDIIRLEDDYGRDLRS